MRFADLEAVTVDGFGTLVELEDPVPRLRGRLAARNVERATTDVARAFGEEARYYRARAHLAADEPRLRDLRRECVAVFLEALGAPLAPDDFVEDFLAALVFRPVPGAAEALASLRAEGLRLAVVSNWDCALGERLAELGLRGCFDEVVTSAAAGAPKPDPAPFRMALERLGTQAGRTLHVGDEPADERGARAVGMHFLPAPLSSAVASLA